MRRANEAKTSRSRQLRSVQTSAEGLLWGRLRGRRLNGFKLARQEPVGPFFADFLCRKARLIIEIDGATHSTEAEIAHDVQREDFLIAKDYRIVRFWNADIFENLDGVCETILAALEKQETL